jgi:23S rRNA U2552 (ribose-2'-O)-methylase RlmE/FtsJ
MGYYAFHLNNREDVKHKILEIGCEKGNSIRMWQEIFPKAEITSLDLFQEYPIPDIRGAEFIAGNQLDHEILYNLRNNRKFDVVIDDGSHNSRDQLVTFWSLVGTSRLYVVEDLHCCNDELYRQGLHFEKTMLGQMKAGTFPYTHYLYDDKIAFIYAD